MLKIDANMCQRLTISYLLANHLGSSSISTDAAGTRTSELRYKPWGQSRYSFGTLPTKYTFTGQYSYMDDPSTPASEGFGLNIGRAIQVV